MANPEHLEILKRGVEAWNKWKGEHIGICADLSGADLSGAHINYADLSDANLRDADLGGAHLNGAYLNRAHLNRAHLNRAHLNGAHLSDAHLEGAHLEGADLSGAHINYADFSDANLRDADLSGADLNYADFYGANLNGANLRGAHLNGAKFTTATLAFTTFADNDLSEVKGLETVSHLAPSSIGVDTLYKSAGKIPEAFLRGCGVPDDFIAFIPSHFGVQQAIQFYSCFISYSTRDEEFARRLYSRMREEELRVWFAPEDIKGGQKIYDQIERAIQMHDRLLLVLSENSMQSEWVITEIQRALEVEKKKNRRKLFPITIVGFDKVKAWRRFDADSGKDLAREVREYFIPDFSNWKEHDAFEQAFARLLRDLKDEETRSAGK